MSRHKVKAFTIMEVTVAMLVTSLVIGITYTVYTIVSRSYSVYQIKNNERANLIRLNDLLKDDFYEANHIIKTKEGVKFISNSKTVDYQIDTKYIIRMDGIIDTFRFNVLENKSTFENAPISDNYDKEQQGDIDDLQLKLLFENEEIVFHYYKQYDSVNLIQQTSYAIN